jgi:hypothetical protein
MFLSWSHLVCCCCLLVTKQSSLYLGGAYFKFLRGGLYKRKALKHAVLRNIISENLNCQAIFDTCFSLPIFNKIARCNTFGDGKIIAEIVSEFNEYSDEHTNKCLFSLKVENTQLTKTLYFKIALIFENMYRHFLYGCRVPFFVQLQFFYLVSLVLKLHAHASVYVPTRYKRSFVFCQWLDSSKDARWNTVSCLYRTPPDDKQLPVQNVSRIIQVKQIIKKSVQLVGLSHISVKYTQFTVSKVQYVYTF